MKISALNFCILLMLGEKVWTLSSSLMFSLTIFTTIGQSYNIFIITMRYEIIVGYGNLTPKTVLGKAMTMVYAIFGIPLMFIYMVDKLISKSIL